MNWIGKQGLFLGASVLLAAVTVTIVAQTAKPKRINRAIELLAEGQPIYYTGSHSGTTGTYEQGMKDAQTYADYISYDMEHAPFDVKGLSEYMHGLAAGGPTQERPSHAGRDRQRAGERHSTKRVRANAWMFKQVLATGVHGVLLTHADDPGAMRAFVEAVRFPIHHEGVGVDGLHGGPPRRSRSADRGADLGHLGGGVRGEGRCVAAQSQRRAAARRERWKTSTRWPMSTRT